MTVRNIVSPFTLFFPVGIAHFARQRVDGDLDTHGLLAGHEFPVKRGDGAGDQWQRFGGSVQ